MKIKYIKNSGDCCEYVYLKPTSMSGMFSIQEYVNINPKNIREYVHKHISKYMKAQLKVFLFRQVSVNTFTNMSCSNKHKSI